MNHLIRNTLAASLLATTLMAAPSFAQPRAMHVPSEEVLATIPGLTQAQRDAIYRIETEQMAERRAMWEAQRAAHQALKEQTTAELRAALGDDAYATYAAWKLEQRAERKNGRHHHRGGHGAATDDSGDATDSAPES